MKKMRERKRYIYVYIEKEREKDWLKGIDICIEKKKVDDLLKKSIF